MFKRIFISTVAILFLVTGCSYKSEVKVVNGEAVKSNRLNNNNFQKVGFNVVPRWNTQNFRKSFLIFKRSCRSGNIDPKFNGACREVKKYKSHKAKSFFEKNFAAYIVSQDNGSVKGKVTGYYESKAFGSLHKSNKYRYPVYAKPNTRFSQKKSRAQINRYGLDAKILCYVDSRYDLFQLHLQGSGTVYLEGGGSMKLGYALSNGRAFKRGIRIRTAVLKDYALFNRATIESWVRHNPKEADYIFNQYDRYIFFAKEDRKASVGAIGMELTPGYSIAVDPKKVPLGSPVMLYTYHNGSNTYINRLVFAQDTGKAIKGQIRADLFFGEGRRAKRNALSMHNKGSMIILLPKNRISRDIKRFIYQS